MLKDNILQFIKDKSEKYRQIRLDNGTIDYLDITEILYDLEAIIEESE